MRQTFEQHPHPGGHRGRRGDFFDIDPRGFGPRGPGRGGRRRMRRGDVRAAILALLAEGPQNGYQLMQEIEQRSEGAWRPSPGSVYPALQQLEDEGLIAPADEGDGKVFKLTDAGSAHFEEHREKIGEPWADLGQHHAGPQHDFRKQLKSLFDAVKQVAQVGDEPTIERANAILAQTRRDLYALLAEDPQDD